MTGKELAMLGTIVKKAAHLLMKEGQDIDGQAEAAFKKGNGGPDVIQDSDVLPYTVELNGLKITVEMPPGVTRLQISNPRYH